MMQALARARRKRGAGKIGLLSGAAIALMLASCNSLPPPPPPAKPGPPVKIAPPSPPPPPIVAPVLPPPPPPSLTLTPAAFADLPGWMSADMRGALEAFRRSCQRWRARDLNAPLWPGARYGGVIADWLPTCSLADQADPAAARLFFEANFNAFAVTSEGGQAKVTGYYEPVFDARRAPEGPFTEPIYARPQDLLRIDLSEFAAALQSDTDTTLKGTLWGHVTGQKVTPYPDRAALPGDLKAIAYAHPADVYDLQVQGSGRLAFPDGGQQRAAYAAPNGRKWNSIFLALRDRGLLAAGELTFAGVRAWMDRAPRELVREILNTDPSVVFFSLEPVTEPSLGPRGAQGVLLTPLASAAVDPSYHPYGALLFIATHGPSLDQGEQPIDRLVVAQDTGGAIRRGPLRMDLFYGSGPQAGMLAGHQNADDPRFWTLLPRTLSQVAQNGGPRSGR